MKLTKKQGGIDLHDWAQGLIRREYEQVYGTVPKDWLKTIRYDFMKLYDKVYVVPNDVNIKPQVVFDNVKDFAKSNGQYIVLFRDNTAIVNGRDPIDVDGAVSVTTSVSCERFGVIACKHGLYYCDMQRDVLHWVGYNLLIQCAKYYRNTLVLIAGNSVYVEGQKYNIAATLDIDNVYVTRIDEFGTLYTTIGFIYNNIHVVIGDEPTKVLFGFMNGSFLPACVLYKGDIFVDYGYETNEARITYYPHGKLKDIEYSLGNIYGYDEEDGLQLLELCNETDFEKIMDQYKNMLEKNVRQLDV
ncbi:MAG: hypothetical protein AB1444_14900 [Spirochaetota bacterium]